MTDQPDPFVKVLDDAEALHDIAMKGVPTDFGDMAENAIDFVLRETRARPLTALAIAALSGFLIAAMTSR